jgi:hypothetical protein
MNGLHLERVSQDKGKTFLSAEIGEPRPGEETFNGHDKAVAVGSNGLEKRFRSGFHLAGYEPLALLTQDTDVHASGMEIDTPGKLMLVRVEAHEVSSFLGNLNFPRPAYHCGVLRGEASIIIKAFHLTPASLPAVAPSGAGERQRSAFVQAAVFSSQVNGLKSTGFLMDCGQPIEGVRQ